MAEHGEPQYEVVWPLGARVVEGGSLPPRLDGLDGKVIAELWDWMFEGDRAFPIIREELRRRFPDVQFVDYTHFGNRLSSIRSSMG